MHLDVFFSFAQESAEAVAAYVMVFTEVRAHTHGLWSLRSEILRCLKLMGCKSMGLCLWSLIESGENLIRAEVLGRLRWLASRT